MHTALRLVGNLAVVVPRSNIHRRLENLEQRAAEQQSPQRTEAGQRLWELLDRYAARKATGNLTREDYKTMSAITLEIKRRRDAGLIGGGGGR